MRLNKIFGFVLLTILVSSFVFASDQGDWWIWPLQGDGVTHDCSYAAIWNTCNTEHCRFVQRNDGQGTAAPCAGSACNSDGYGYCWCDDPSDSSRSCGGATTTTTTLPQQQTCGQFCGSGYIAGCYNDKVPSTPNYDHAVCGGGTDNNRCFKRQANKWSQDTTCNGWCSCYTCEEVALSFCGVTTTTLPSCNSILSVSVTKSTLSPGESFTCSVTAARGNEGGIHCGIAKNNQWVSGCSFTGWSGNTASFSCSAPSQTDTYDVIGYNFECETPDKVTHITVQTQPTTTTTIPPYCTQGWKCQDSTHKGYQQTDCSWSSVEYCQYGCENGYCKQGPQPPQCTPGWNCDGNWKYYLNSDCSKSNWEYCSYGCANGQCKSPTTTTTIPPYCTQGWKCQDSTHKGYQQTDCSWSSVEYCQYGCENGYCKQAPQCDIEYFCSGNWVMKKNTDCSVSQIEFCENGCSNGRCISEPEESRVEIISTNVDPERVCENDDRTIELSAGVKLDQGDDESVTVRFYVEDNHGDWEYIGSDSETLDEDETRTFEINYYYDEDELDIGTHEIKFVAATHDDEDVKYDYLYVRDCVDYDDYSIDVKNIILDPEFPERCEAVLVTVPIELKEAPDFPQDVYVKAYIDSNLEYSTTMKYYDEESRVFKFTFDSCDYATGTHSIRVDARVDSVSDSSSKSFTISDGYIYFDSRSHCLDVEKIWVDKPIQPDEDIRVYAKITNCGTETESGIRANLEAFGMVMFDGMFSLLKDGSREIMFNLHIPEDAAGTESFVVKTWDAYTSDVLIKDFVVYTGVPMIEIEPVQKVQKGRIEKIRFDVINVGQVTDTFALELSGYASNWMYGMPPEVTLESGQRGTVEVYVNVPVDVESRDYQFTVAAQGSPRYAVTSTLRVVEGFKWPSLTGMLVFVGWLPWLLLLLLFVGLFLLLLWLASRMGRSGRGIPEGKIGSFFKFDDCC